MYHVDEGLEGPVIDADDLREFSPEDRRQVLQVMQQVGRNLDLIVYIKSNGREDFTFIGELEVRFNYFFIDDANPQLEPIVKRNNVRKFKIQAPVYCPFDYGFDFQIINPLVRHMNYESNNMKKSFLVNEPGLIVFNIENRGQRIQLKRVAISPNEANRDKYNVIRVAELKDLLLEELEQAKLQLFIQPIEETIDFTIGRIVISWLRSDLENLSSNQICSLISGQVY